MDKHFIAILLLSLIVYFCNLGGTSIYILDEAKNAGCAMEMLQRGDVVVPTFNGKLRTDKPPLHYYFMMASYKIFGVTPFAARFFSGLCGVLLIIVVYQNIKRLIDVDTARFTSLILLSSAQLAVQFHLAVPDPYLILLMTISLFFFFIGYHEDPKLLKWFYITTALGFLTKGLIAVVLPGLIIFLYLLILKQLRWRLLKQLKIAQGILLFCVVALPWYVAVGIATNGEWLQGFFIEHNIERYTSTKEGHNGFLLAPFVIVCVALLPFSVFIIQSIQLALREWKKNTLLLFCMIACLVIAGFFSLSKTILPSYPAPAFPFMAVLLGNYLAYLVKSGYQKGVTVGIILNFLIGILLVGGAYFILKQDPQLDSLRDIAWIFLVLPIGGIIGWYFFRKRNVAAWVYSWAGSWIMLILIFFYWAYPRLDKMNPVTQSIPLIRQLEPTHRIVAFRIFNPAYIFTMQRIVEVVDSPKELIKILNNKENLLVITRSKYLKELSTGTTLHVVYEGKDLFENNETVLLTN